MTRQECESKILELLKQIDAVYLEYNPRGDYLTLSTGRDRYMFNNRYWDEDKNKPIEVFFRQDIPKVPHRGNNMTTATPSSKPPYSTPPRRGL